MKMRMKEEMLWFEESARGEVDFGLVRQDEQAEDTPEDDDVKVEDVCDSQREAEDDAEDSGPGRIVLLALCTRVWKLHVAYHCPYIPEASELAGV